MADFKEERVDQIWDFRKLSISEVPRVGNNWERRKTRDRGQLEAVVVQERDTVAWPKVMGMGMERRGTAKGHSAG